MRIKLFFDIKNTYISAERWRPKYIHASTTRRISRAVLPELSKNLGRALQTWFVLCEATCVEVQKNQNEPQMEGAIPVDERMKAKGRQAATLPEKAVVYRMKSAGGLIYDVAIFKQRRLLKMIILIKEPLHNSNL